MNIGLPTSECFLRIRKGLFVLALVSLISGACLVCLLDSCTYEVRIIVSGSMDGEPMDYPIASIPVGSLVMIDKTSDFTVGDVIAFRMHTDDGEIVIVHRVLDMDGMVTTHGDANPDNSVEYVERSDVIGKVIYVNSAVGNAAWFVKNNIPSIIMMIILSSFMSYALSNIIKEIRKGSDMK